MVKKSVLALLVAGILAAPAASAQIGDAFDVSVEANGGEVPWDGSKQINFTVELGCAHILEAGGSLQVDVSTDLPDDYNAGTESLTFTADQGCLNPSGSKSMDGSFTLTPGQDAWGLNKTKFKVMATDGGETVEAEHADEIWISYRDGHQVTPNITFPYTMTPDDGGKVQFTVTVEVTANSDTMVMFLEPTTEGSLGGLTHQIMNIKTLGVDSVRTLNVTWTPPAASWDNATISFRQVSHCLDSGFDCPFTNEQNTTWVIQNGGVGGGGGGDGGDQESPGAAPISLALALVAVAFLASRRR